LLGSLLTNLEEFLQRRRDGMNFIGGGQEKSNLNQTSTSSRDHEGAIPFHLPWRGRRFDGEKEERGREKEERRESKTNPKPRERKRMKNEIFLVQF
jgi:hypothetical protein